MNFKLIGGLGLACAACCAIPLFGFGGLALGGTGIAGLLGASLDQIICYGGLLLLVGGAGYYFWHRNRKQKFATCQTDGSCGCKVSGD
jgi:hypothetical protein